LTAAIQFSLSYKLLEDDAKKINVSFTTEITMISNNIANQKILYFSDFDKNFINNKIL